MAAEIQTGAGTIYGVANDGTAIAIPGYATFLIQSAGLEHQFDITDVKDGGGFDATAVAVNEHTEITIDFVMSGATRAAAAAIGVFLTPLSSVALTHFKISAFNGTWQYRGGAKIDLSNNASGKLSGLKLRKYADATQNTALTTTVTG